jgi:hypothetical protein
MVTSSFGKRNFMQEAQLALMNGPGFSFQRRGDMDFFVYSLVPNLFPSGSQSVRKCVP